MQRNKSLDGMRGFGVLYVVFGHIVDMNLSLPGINPLWWDFAMAGNRFVSLFFCVSGFLVYDSLLKLRQTAPNPNFAFYLRRFFRIIPLWWTLLVILLIADQISWDVMLANMVFFFGDLSNQTRFFPIFPSWTLLTEEFFYILLPLAFPFLNKKRTLVLFALSFAAAMLGRYFLIKQYPGIVPPGFVYRNPVGEGRFVLMGILVYQVLQDDVLKRKWERFINIVGINFFSVVSIFLFWNFEAILGVNFLREISVLMMLLLILNGKGGFNRFVSNPIFMFCGVRCYGLYILQQSAWEMSFKWVPVLEGSHSFVIFGRYFLTLLILVPLATVSFHFLERPFNRFAKNPTWLFVLFSKKREKRIA